MSAHTYVVFSNPAEGRDDEYNRWYNDVHLDEVLQVPGFVSATRHRIEPQDGAEPEYGYVALYQIESDPEPALAELMRRAGSGELQMSDALGGVRTMLVREIARREA